MSHTPGPWWVLDGRFSDGAGQLHILIGDQEDRVCEVNMGECAGCEDANASLIAAAPDLLEALKAFVGYYDQAGIGDCTEEDESDPPDGFDGDEVVNVRLARAAIAKATDAARDGGKQG